MIHRLYWGVYSTFFPQHKSLRKAIPRKWMDLDGIVDDFLDAVIISFVEEEDGVFSQIKMIESYERLLTFEIERDWGSIKAYNDYRNDRLPNLEKLAEIYIWVKTGRKIMQNALDAFDEKDDYISSARLAEEINNKNTEYYGELIKLRGYLWT